VPAVPGAPAPTETDHPTSEAAVGGEADPMSPGRKGHLANLRDVGGLPTLDGGVTRPGVLWRADAPMPDDLTSAADTPGGLVWPPGSVVDLRNPSEFTGPHPLIARGSQVTALPLIESLAPDARARGRRGELTTEEMYLLLLDIGAAWLPQLVSVAAHGPGPLLVHCAAGKDRTGVAVALLLRAAGVDRATVTADFAATNARRRALCDRLVAQGMVGDDIPAEEIGVDPAHLEPVLDLLDDDPRAPLRAAGVPDEDLDAWRARLVDAT
jgi:protein-tyrosine phosphatase